jgi:hypothetical protein
MGKYKHAMCRGAPAHASSICKSICIAAVVVLGGNNEDNHMQPLDSCTWREDRQFDND